MPIEQLVLMIPITALLIPIVAIITHHKRKMAELQARMTSGLSAEVRAELSEIKGQLAELRETTTKFDIAFDAALTRLEERVERVEQRPIGGVTTEAALRAGRGAEG